MARFCSLIIISILIYSTSGFSQNKVSTPKWHQFYIGFGSSVGFFDSESRSFRFNTAGYKKNLGKFGYGANYNYHFLDGTRISNKNVTMSFNPDWDLEVSPIIEIGFGLTNIEKNSSHTGTNISGGIGFELMRSNLFSSGVFYRVQNHTSDYKGFPHNTLHSIEAMLSFHVY